MSREAKKLNPLTMTDQELIEHCNKQVQALRMALDMIECEKHDRRHVRWVIVDALKEWQPAQQEPVAWGVDWGKAGDAPCVSIIKRLPGCGIEVVAVEYGSTPLSWIEVQQVKWEGDKLLAKLKENT